MTGSDSARGKVEAFGSESRYVGLGGFDIRSARF